MQPLVDEQFDSSLPHADEMQPSHPTAPPPLPPP